MEVKVEKLSQEELKSRGIFSWPIWEKGISKFDWHYDTCERCYFLEGKVSLTCKGGKEVSFGKGDFVTFPEGLSCVWDVREPVKKHYKFGK